MIFFFVYLGTEQSSAGLTADSVTKMRGLGGTAGLASHPILRLRSLLLSSLSASNCASWKPTGRCLRNEPSRLNGFGLAGRSRLLDLHSTRCSLFFSKLLRRISASDTGGLPTHLPKTSGVRSRGPLSKFSWPSSVSTSLTLLSSSKEITYNK